MPNSNDAYLPLPLDTMIRSSIKVAVPDLFIDDETLSIESMTDFTFTEVGGQEILSVSRHDLIDSPLSDNNMVRSTGSLFKKTKYIESNDSIINTFGVFAINLNDKIPSSIELPTSTTNPVIESRDNIYITSDGAINIILKNLDSKYKVEVDFFATSEIVDGTIY